MGSGGFDHRLSGGRGRENLLHFHWFDIQAALDVLEGPENLGTVGLAGLHLPYQMYSLSYLWDEWGCSQGGDPILMKNLI